MKKVISLLLVLACCLSLCACGEKNDTTQNDTDSISDSIASASFLDLDLMYNTIQTNQAQAKMQYDGKMFKVKVTVMNIGTNNFTYSFKNYRGETKNFDIFMPTEVLATLSNGSHIIVFGELVLNGSSANLQDAIVVDESNIGEKTFDEQTIKAAIENFDPHNSSGNIDWGDDSSAFFIDNRLYFEKITLATFYTEMSGEWKGKYYTERNTEYLINFTSNSTAEVSKNGEEASEWNYTFSGGMIKFPNNSAIKPREVRKVSDNVIVIYEYTTDYVPYWILYKE